MAFRSEKKMQKASDETSKAFVVVLTRFRLSGCREATLLTCAEEFSRPLGSSTLRLHRQHGAAANDTLIALRLIEVYGW